MEKLELEVQLSEKQYYHFNLYHCYHSFNGFLSIILGLLCMVYGVWGIVDGELLTTAQIVMFAALGVLFIVYNPIALFMRSKRRFLQNPVMKKPVTYIFSKSGIMLKQGEVEEEMKWENIYKVVKTKESMIFYLTRYHANIVPLCEIGEKYEEVCRYISKYADAKVMRFKM